MALSIIAYSSKIAAGTNVVAFYGTAVALPSEETLRQAVAPFGDPFTLTYMSVPHIGVRVSGETSALELSMALQAATAGGPPPLLVALPPGAEDAVEIEIGGEEVAEALKGFAGGLAETVKGGLLPGGSAFPLLVGAAVLGAVLIGIGAALYLTRKKG